MNTNTVAWWKSGVVYQIYPRSFCDSNGDGVGDLRGVINKLDHLVELGIDIVWLTPFFPSPNHDNGYDITDYDGVDPEMGTPADVDELIAQCHARGVRVVMDAVPNHTSSAHPWFVESRASKTSAKRDWYFWRPGRDGGPPNNWSAGFAPSAWTLDDATGEYYLHYYTPSMPDLNWDHPPVRDALFGMLRRWLDRGIDGLRLDSINLVKKNTAFPDATTPDPVEPGHGYDPDQIYNQPGLLQHLQALRREVLDGRNVMTVGETSNTPAEVALDFVHPRNQVLDMVFNFEPVELELPDLVQLKSIYRRWASIVEQGGWITQYLSNHDQPRQVSRFGNDREHRVASAKALALMLHTLPGTPFVYQGEEIGMVNCAFERIEDYDDVSSHNRYRGLLAAGHSASAALAEVQRTSRDNARTPMPWNGEPGAGFSSGRPWLPVSADWHEINVEAARRDPDSVFHFYRQLIALRKANPVLVQGDFIDHLPEHPRLFVYSRSFGAVRWWTLLNLSDDEVDEALAFELPTGLVLGTRDAPALDGRRLRLRPWEAVLLSGPSR